MKSQERHPSRAALGAASVALRRVGWLVSSLVVLGCDGIGAPIVDELPDEHAVGPMGCRVPPTCEPLQALETPSRTALPVDLTSCSLERPICNVDPTRNEAGADGGVDMTGNAAADVPAREGPRPTCLDPESTSALAPQLACTASGFVARDAQAALQLSAAVWRDSNVALTTATPLRIELRDADLQRVFVRLEGPVTLRFERSNFDDVRILATHTRAGRPRLELVRAFAQTLTLANGDDTMADQIVVKDSVLRDAVLRAEQIDLESTAVSNSSIRATRLNVTDTSFDEVDLRADSALLSAFKAVRSRMAYCTDVKMVSGQVLESGISACEGVLIQAYETELSSSSLDGSVLADMSVWGGVRLGAEGPTEIALFGTSVSAMALCDGVVKLAIGPRSSIRCSACVRGFAEAEAACVLPDSGEPELGANFCAVLTEQPVPASCGKPLPERTRPARAL